MISPLDGDTLEIENLLTRYCRAVDSKDWPLYRSLFTDDARVDYSAAGLFTGTCDDAVAYLERHQAAISVGMHYVTNVESRVDGGTAHVVAMWFNAVALPHKPDITFFGGRWHNEMTRTPQGWRIRTLRLEVV
ncbi:nuclear transport factor 2 family protein [Mycobacterium sp. SMC-4]|uniref:nuclear transport factor 2 family protein n=1 Tax=Mycobacterium sp. SMC-4 TaxID=2857059 RepID=UPI003D077DDF